MKTTQCERILRHLKDFGSISDNEAGDMYGTRRLASRNTTCEKLALRLHRRWSKARTDTESRRAIPCID